MSRLIAINEAREFFFTVSSKEMDKVTVNMYNTDYVFIKTDKGWVNAPGNKNNAVPGLINGVLKALGMQ